MSKPMEESLENLKKVLEKSVDESQINRIKEAAKIISQNRKKIWLRTKTGKPFAEKTQMITEKLVNQVETEVMEHILIELEEQVTIIQEESSRRSMVVT